MKENFEMTHCSKLLMMFIMIMVPGCNGKKLPKTMTLQKSGLFIKKEVFNPCKEINISYPVISGFADPSMQKALNTKLKQLFFVNDASSSQDVTDTTFECDFEFEQLNNVLIITQHSYYYEEGSVHGMPSLQFFHINTQTGELYHLKDLLNSEDDLERIRILLQEKFETKKPDLGYLVDVIPPISANQCFKLVRTGIEIYFHPYEIACYADGFPSFELTWGQMGDALNMEGSFFKALER